MDLAALLTHAHARLDAWEASFGPFERHPSVVVDEAAMQAVLERYLLRLRGNYPFFHPRYAGQMVKPPHPAALVAAAAAMRLNPNNHALDGGPPTSAMEKELVPRLAVALGMPATSLGHLTAGGTIANLEALFIAREEHPGKGIAVSEAAHYTHTRMAHVLGIEARVVPADAAGRLDVDALEAVLREGRTGTVVVTAGTTGLGAVDPIADVLPLARRYGARVHVDGAYGGFFCLLAHAGSSWLGAETRRHLAAAGGADSFVVDPHKHGLQPYGCGYVCFRDPEVGRHYVHDSPYTYFTSDDLHLGEISLECSRAGAAAGALWLTLELLPLAADQGLGPILAAGLEAARTWADAVEAQPPPAPAPAPRTRHRGLLPEGRQCRRRRPPQRRALRRRHARPRSPHLHGPLHHARRAPATARHRAGRGAGADPAECAHEARTRPLGHPARVRTGCPRGPVHGLTRLSDVRPRGALRA